MYTMSSSIDVFRFTTRRCCSVRRSELATEEYKLTNNVQVNAIARVFLSLTHMFLNNDPFFARSSFESFSALIAMRYTPLALLTF